MWLVVTALTAAPTWGQPISVRITGDNGYGFGWGTQFSITNYQNGVESAGPDAIFGCGATDATGPENYTIPSPSVTDYIYIIAWSDESGTQGVLGQFLYASNPTPTVTGKGAWEVCATGRDVDPADEGSGPPLNGPPGSNAINAQISMCNLKQGNPATSSGGWVGVSRGLAFGPGSQVGISIPTPMPMPCIDASAQWMWFNSNGSLNPFLATSAGDGGHKEYLIFRLPMTVPLNVTSVGANKDFQNNTGTTVNDFEWLIEGDHPDVIGHYDGLFDSQPNSEFSSFTISPSGPNTLFRWSDTGSIANGDYAHFGFSLRGTSVKTLGASWTVNGAFAGCAHQVNVDGQGISGGGVTFTNDATTCENKTLYASQIRLEWFTHGVALQDLMADGVRNPMRIDILGDVAELPPNSEQTVSTPVPPLGARFVMVQYTVSDSPILSGPGNTRDYLLFPLPPPSVPALSARGALLTAALIMAGMCMVVRQLRASSSA
jgi:hypothetical protein